MGDTEKYVPFGLVDENRGQLHVTFGRSSKPRDVIVDSLSDGWNETPMAARAPIAHRHLQVDKGPERSGVRTQFLKRLVDFADHTGKPIQLLYAPPDPSPYQPLERGWGLLEQHGHGTTLVAIETRLGGAHRMTWKGLPPIVNRSRTVYPKGGSLSTKAMRAVEARGERHPLLPKGDILIRPA